MVGSESPRSKLAVRFVLFVIGAVLVFTAVGKIWLLLSDPFADIRTGFPIAVLWFGAFLELSVVWLLTSKAKLRAKWASVSILFATFFVVSCYRWVLGQNSCGCTGFFEFPTWASAGFSLLVLLALWRVRVVSIGEGRGWIMLGSQNKETMSAISGATGLLLLGLVTSLASTFWSPLSGLLPGARGVRSVARVELEDLKLGEIVEASVTLQNSTDVSVWVLGSRTSCDCMSSQDGKIEIPAHGEVAIPIIIKPKTIGDFYNRIVFFLDSPKQRSVLVNLSGLVILSE